MNSSNYTVKFGSIMSLLLVIGTLYYFKVISFTYGLLFSGGRDLLTAATDGSPVNKFSGSIIILLTGFCLIYKKIIFRKSFWKKNYLMWLIPLFCFISVSWSVEPNFTLKRSIAVLALFLFALHLTTFYKPVDLLYFIGCVIAYCALAGLLLGIVIPSHVFIEGGIRGGVFLGILADKNAGARAYAIGLAILFPYFLKKDKKSTFLMIPIFIALCLSQSASGLALAVIGISTVLYFNYYPYNKNSKYFLGQVLISLGIFLFIGLIIYLAKEFAFHLLGRNSDLTDRKIIWELLQPHLDDKPILGHGFGAFWNSVNAQDFIERWGFIGNAHNGYIETKLDGGIVFLILINSLIVFTALKTLIRIPSETTAKESSVCLAIIIMVLVANTIGHVVPNYYAIDFLILLIAMFLSLGSKNNEK